MQPEIVQNLLSAVILAIVSLVAFGLRGLIQVGILYLKNKLGDTQYQRLVAYAEATVRMLEQHPAFKDLDGAQKKERAIVEITQFAQSIGLPVDQDYVSKIIEACVQIINTEKGKIEE